MKSQRQLQIGENIKRIMSDIFLRDDILHVPGSIITVLEADVSPDAKNAKIYIDIFGNEAMHAKIVDKLNEAAPHFRYQMAKKVTLRVVPEISFVLDRTQQKAMSLEALIEEEGKKYNASQSVAKKPKSRSAAKKK
jgi:ribosome-binding factor A